MSAPAHISLTSADTALPPAVSWNVLAACAATGARLELMLSIGSVVINVSDVRRAAAFWGAALGYEPLREIQDDWVILVPAGGAAGQRISINLSDQPAPDVPHVHLDLYAGDAADQAAEVDRLVGLGAERVEWPHYPDGPHDFVVLADPDGNKFCVIDTVSN